MDINLFRVVFKPGKSLNPISDEWGNIEIEGEALANALRQVRHLDSPGGRALGCAAYA